MILSSFFDYMKMKFLCILYFFVLLPPFFKGYFIPKILALVKVFNRNSFI